METHHRHPDCPVSACLPKHIGPVVTLISIASQLPRHTTQDGRTAQECIPCQIPSITSSNRLDNDPRQSHVKQKRYSILQLHSKKFSDSPFNPTLQMPRCEQNSCDRQTQGQAEVQLKNQMHYKVQQVNYKLQFLKHRLDDSN